MSHNILERDLQTGLENAWHGLTQIVECVTRDNSMPFEVVESPILYEIPTSPTSGETTTIADPEYKVLLADDDWLRVGEPYGPSYTPSSIGQFWEIIRKGMGSTPYKIVSAGTVSNRSRIFASLKVSDGFRIGDREFKDYITLIDSFDKTTSLQCRYSNICVVCNNTFTAVMGSGEVVGKAKHTLMLENNIHRLVNAIEQFAGTSQAYETMLSEASKQPVSRDEARAWFAGIEGRNMNEPTNALIQRTARMSELFSNGRGNLGATKLDAFSAFTEFHTHESTNRKADRAQYMTSEFGASAAAKTMVVTRFRDDWDTHVKRGTRLLEKGNAVLSA